MDDTTTAADAPVQLTPAEIEEAIRNRMADLREMEREEREMIRDFAMQKRELHREINELRQLQPPVTDGH